LSMSVKGPTEHPVERKHAPSAPRCIIDLMPDDEPVTHSHQPTDPTIARVLRADIPGLQAAYRFGSTVSGETHAASDVDVAFIAADPITVERCWEVAGDLAAELARNVDLVDLRRASTVMRMQVLRNAVTIVDDDPTALAWFEMLSLSDYARLNEERRGILEDVKERGRVYG
jgi:predicted nucleotidyltransferase